MAKYEGGNFKGDLKGEVLGAVLTAVVELVVKIILEIPKVAIKLAKKGYSWYVERQKLKEEEAQKVEQEKAEQVNIINDPEDKIRMNANRPVLIPIIDGWIWAGDVGYIVAPTGVGKTTLSVGLACALANGDATVLDPDKPAMKHKVLYYMLDMREDGVKYNFPHMDDYYPMLKCGVKSGGMSMESLIKDIYTEVAATTETFTMVIIDNLNRVRSKKLLHEALESLREEVKKRMDKMITCIILNHTSTDYDAKRYYLPIKVSDAEGYKDDSRNADFFIALNKTRLGEDYAIVTQNKLRYGQKKKGAILLVRKENPLRFESMGDRQDVTSLLPEKDTVVKGKSSNWTLQDGQDETGPKSSWSRAAKNYTDEQFEAFLRTYEEAIAVGYSKERAARYAALVVADDEKQWKTLLRKVERWKKQKENRFPVLYRR